jgi:hypothetical protein
MSNPLTTGLPNSLNTLPQLQNEKVPPKKPPASLSPPAMGFLGGIGRQIQGLRGFFPPNTPGTIPGKESTETPKTGELPASNASGNRI